MEINNKPEKHINDIVRSEYQPTLKEKVVGSKVARKIFYVGVAIFIYSAGLAMAALAEESPPPSPFPGQETREPRGEHYGRDKTNGNHYGFRNIDKGNKYGWE